MLKKVVFYIVAASFVCSCAPRSKQKINYDQKQTGDYNIRLNLKDFQIIALLGDDSFGDIGNYDYNYDYSELTLKPSTSTTEKPLLSSSTELSSTTIKNVQNILTSTKATTTNSHSAPTTIKSISTSEAAGKLTTEKVATTRKIEEHSPDKIPVFVQGNKTEGNKRNISSNVSIVTDDEKLPNEAKRCAQGYGRDKRGRCRKYRRPQFPFELARIASSLAAKLTPVSSEDSSSIEE